MRMKAKTAFHSGQTDPRTVLAGAEFETTDAIGKELEARGLAEPVGGAKTEPPPENKAEAPPLNKMEPASVNKTGRTKRLPPEPTPSDRASSTEE